MQGITIVANRVAFFLLASAVAFGAAGDKTKVKGMIISRTGETLIVNTDRLSKGEASSPEGRVTVVLADDTRTKDDRGLFGWEKQEMSSVVLMPGLKVKIDGVSDDQGRVLAKTITVDGDDLEAAQMIESGLHPTAQQVEANVQTLEVHKQGIAANKQGVEANKQGVEANQQGVAANQQNIAANKENIEQSMKDIQENTDRFSALSDYDVKGQATVKFPVGSSRISKQDGEQLKQLAQTATGLKGYIIEVTGYADATGNAAMNTKLSENRAKAVVTFLTQQGSVPVRHIVAPGAMGEYGAAASNETKAGRSENRRVEVKVLVNKGINGA